MGSSFRLLGMILTLGLLLCSQSIAQEETETNQLFQSLDSNQDRHLEAGELKEEHLRLFQRLLRTSDAG